jgi:3-methyladenine DNA glycosylase AlkD
VTVPKGPRALIEDLRSTLQALGDPVKATGMQRYMKSAMPYYGVPAVPLRKACKEVFARHPLETQKAFEAAVRGLWRSAERREERYAAIELAGLPRYRAYRTLALLPLFEEMIVSGAWWDLVDALATHRLGELLRNHPGSMKRTMLRWARSRDLWKRRSAILCQIGSKTETDVPLLFACIEPSLDSDEFFLRKAIGWALRQYAWTDPDAVVRYVKRNERRLSGLSRREALKNVGRGKPRSSARSSRASRRRG